MCKNVCFPESNIQRYILEIENMEDKTFTDINNYINNVKLHYKAYKTRKYIKDFLRLLLIIGGFTITTMTTYNNPYFKENSDRVNILVWYFSISNNVINLILEKLNGYNLEDDKLKIKLLINEGKLYDKNLEDYSFYPLDNSKRKEKIEYFNEKCKKIIENNSYHFLTRNIFIPEHTIDDINKSKRKRLKNLWVKYTPPNTVNTEYDEQNITNSNDLEVEDINN